MDKSRARDRLRAVGLTNAESSRLVVEGLREWLAGRLPGTVAAYLAMPDEVDVTPLFEKLPGWNWVLPRVEASGFTLRDRDVPWEVHALGMRQPIDSGTATPLSHVDVFLVPGLGFDHSGARLGRGGGFFDRLLTQKRSDSLAVGVTVEARVVESIPMESHDQLVGWLATEAGVRECSPKR